VGFLLQSESLLSPTNWVDATNSLAIIGSEITVTESLPNTNKFFRLRSF